MKKNMKKASLMMVLALVMVLFSACWPGEIRSEMKIENETGKGTKTIVAEILKEGQPKPDGNGKVETLQHLPKGFASIGEWLQENKPEEMELVLSEDDTKYIYTFTYDFENIEEYNTKTKAIAGDAWTDYKIEDATLSSVETKVDGDNKYEVTFNESPNVLYVSMLWAIEGIYYNKEIFDNDPNGTGATEIERVFKIKTATIEMNGVEETIDIENGAPTALKITGHFDREANTNMIIMLLVGIALIIVSIFIYMKRKK